MRKVILVTGASAGIGREAAILLAREGHAVYAGARRLDRLEELTEHGITPVEMDVTHSDDNERAVSRIIEEEGRIDVLINNAGFGLYGPVEEIPLDDARYQFEVNLFGLAHLTQLVLPHMRPQRSGRIINVSSVVGKIFVPLGAWYVATKHALEGWSDCLRLEAAPFNIHVALVEPGAIRTEFFDVTRGRLEEYFDEHRVQGAVRTVPQDVQGSESQGSEHRGPRTRRGVGRSRDNPQTPPQVRQGPHGAARALHQEVARRRDLRVPAAPRFPLTDPFSPRGCHSGLGLLGSARPVQGHPRSRRRTACPRRFLPSSSSAPG